MLPSALCVGNCRSVQDELEHASTCNTYSLKPYRATALVPQDLPSWGSASPYVTCTAGVTWRDILKDRAFYKVHSRTGCTVCTRNACHRDFRGGTRLQAKFSGTVVCNSQMSCTIRTDVRIRTHAYVCDVQVAWGNSCRKENTKTGGVSTPTYVSTILSHTATAFVCPSKRS